MAAPDAARARPVGWSANIPRTSAPSPSGRMLRSSCAPATSGKTTARGSWLAPGNLPVGPHRLFEVHDRPDHLLAVEQRLVVVIGGHFDECLRRDDGVVEAPRVIDRHDGVMGAGDDEHRSANPGSAV